MVIPSRRFHRVPGQRRALDARGILPDAGKDLELAEVVVRALVGFELAFQQLMKLAEELAGFLDGFPFERQRHHTRRSLRDRAAGALEGDVGDQTVRSDLEIDPKVVAAQRVIAFRLVRRAVELAEVPGLLVVLQNHLLVEVGVRRHANILTTFWIASASTSISAVVL
jgi:hypothetical protein